MLTEEEIRNGIKAYVTDLVRDLLPDFSSRTRAMMIKKVSEGKPLFKVLGLNYDEVRATVVTALEAGKNRERLS